MNDICAGVGRSEGWQLPSTTQYLLIPSWWQKEDRLPAPHIDRMQTVKQYLLVLDDINDQHVFAIIKYNSQFKPAWQHKENGLLDKTNDLFHMMLTEDKDNEDFLQPFIHKILHSLCILKTNSVNQSTVNNSLSSHYQSPL